MADDPNTASHFLGFDIDSPEKAQKELDHLNKIIAEFASSEEVVGKQQAKKNEQELPEVLGYIHESMQRVNEKGMKYKDAFGMSDKSVEGIYSYAHQLYKQGQYEEALGVFKQVVLLDPSNFKYVYALAANLQMCKEYLAASKTYAIAAALESENPLPFFYMAECFMNLDDLFSTVAALNMTIERAEKQEKHKGLFEKCVASRDVLYKQLEILAQKEEHENTKEGEGI